MSDLLDTIMNLEIFAFIAALVWLYFREPPDQEEPQNTLVQTKREKAQSEAGKSTSAGRAQDLSRDVQSDGGK